MEKYKVIFQEEKSKYTQIYIKIKKLIETSKIEEGEKLPSIRKLASFLDVNNVTVVNAYKKLEEEGYAVQKIGSGTYAKKKDNGRGFRKEYAKAFKAAMDNTKEKYIDFTGEATCVDYFPVDILKKVIDEVLDRDGAEALVYQETLGYHGLRKSINHFFWQGALNDEDILVVSGAQQGIDIVTKSIVNVNDNVIVEKPTYSGALSVFKWRKANIIEVNMLKDGIDLEQLKKILKSQKIKCFYAMSYFQNPTGTSYSIEKKKKILEYAETYDFYIIEDDYLSELIYNKDLQYKSFKSLDVNDRVIYIKSFSKIFLPGIRLGYLVSPVRFIETIKNSKINTDISTSSLMQRTLDLYIEKGYWKEYINKLNEIYVKKYTFAMEKIKDILKDKVTFNEPQGGLSFYLKISDKVKMDSISLFYKCKEKSVLITPGVLFYKFPHEGKKYFKLSFSQISNEDFENGLKVINDVLVYS
ncbi:PLP-dependent aminotransferase family protein [Haloimpatiens lingqiaonensis]|uniref:MocR-like pyridoxine biosynthesis transcription factor PdxR n=1 Tax=Haloimpatiens lingqiaonensis TaxID=1380675 RepID=UPI0010FD5AA3|nr:PLP-dependent aminotransferase family protein [Haloimpatiens lingqiaonensis]